MPDEFDPGLPSRHLRKEAYQARKSAARLASGRTRREDDRRALSWRVAIRAGPPRRRVHQKTLSAIVRPTRRPTRYPRHAPLQPIRIPGLQNSFRSPTPARQFRQHRDSTDQNFLWSHKSPKDAIAEVHLFVDPGASVLTRRCDVRECRAICIPARWHTAMLRARWLC